MKSAGSGKNRSRFFPVFSRKKGKIWEREWGLGKSLCRDGKGVRSEFQKREREETGSLPLGFSSNRDLTHDSPPKRFWDRSGRRALYPV